MRRVSTSVVLATALLTPAAEAGGDPIDDPIPGPIAESDVFIRLTEVSTGLIAPNWGTSAPVGDRLYVTDQTGILYAIDVGTGDKVVFLDVSAQLVALGIGGPDTFDERGLLGVAFHPDYARNGLLYTYQSEPVDGPADFSTLGVGEKADHQAVIAEWQVANPGAEPDPLDPDTLVDPASKRVLLRVDEPQFNHDGGAVNFGPDGMLYVAFGDGGAADDQGIGHSPEGNGADPGNILGTIIRIDPQGNDAANGQYGVPADNPFVGRPGFVEEIFAYGFRNPFRFSFDSLAPELGGGTLIAADVGQNDIEEIDVVVSGGNYGWRFKEGTFFFEPNGDGSGFVTDEPAGNEPPDLIDPIAQYDHDEGIAIIGGFVYRGSSIPALHGRYVFGEFAVTFAADGRLFHLDGANQVREFPLLEQDDFGLFLLGFGQDADGEIYALANATGIPFPSPVEGPTGVVLRLDPSATPFVDLGSGKAGSGGLTPALAGSGSLAPGRQATFELTDALAGSTTSLVVGASSLGAPFKGGTLVPAPDVIFFGLPVDGLGENTVSSAIPVSVPPGAILYLQHWVADPGATEGLSASNGLQATTQLAP